MTTFLLTAAEPSGDAIGAQLMKAIAGKRPGSRFVGAGGKAMRAAGLEGDLDTEKLAVMGPMDALAVLPRAVSLASKLGRLASSEEPAAAVLIDSWVFSKMVAKKLRAASPGTKLVKFAAPQVWASRPRRAGEAAELFDEILCLLPFEPGWFTKAGGRATFVGNPNFQHAAQQHGSGTAFRQRHNLAGAPLLAMLPGSRSSEVQRLLPIYEETYREILRRDGRLRAAVVAAPSVEEEVRREVASWEGEVVTLPATERFDAFDAADVALAASGTVSTELALSSTPMVVTYKVGALTAAWARRVITSPYVTVLNIAAGDEIIPERLQGDATPVQLAADVVRLLKDEEARRRQLSAFRRLLPELLGPKNPADIAAQAILDLVDGNDGGGLHRSAAR